VMLRGIKAGQQGRPAGRTHTRIAESPVKTEAILLEKSQGFEVIFFPIVRKMLRSSFLIGDDHDNVGVPWKLGEAFGKTHRRSRFFTRNGLKRPNLLRNIEKRSGHLSIYQN